MDPVSLALLGASVGGGLLSSFGQKKQKGIDPEWLKRQFGAEQVNEEMIKLFNHVINSPYGQQLLTNAAEQGSQFERAVAQRAAAAGMGPSGGAESGSSIFSQAAAGGATNALQRDVRGGVMQSVMPVAQQLVQGRMNAAVQGELQRLSGENAQPSGMAAFGDALARGGNAGLSAGLTSKPTTDPGLMSGASAPLAAASYALPGGTRQPAEGTRGSFPENKLTVSGQVPQLALQGGNGPGGSSVFSRMARGVGRFGRLVLPKRSMLPVASLRAAANAPMEYPTQRRGV